MGPSWRPTKLSVARFQGPEKKIVAWFLKKKKNWFKMNWFGLGHKGQSIISFLVFSFLSVTVVVICCFLHESSICCKLWWPTITLVLGINNLIFEEPVTKNVVPPSQNPLFLPFLTGIGATISYGLFTSDGALFNHRTEVLLSLYFEGKRSNYLWLNQSFFWTIRDPLISSPWLWLCLSKLMLVVEVKRAQLFKPEPSSSFKGRTRRARACFEPKLFTATRTTELEALLSFFEN